MTIIRHDNGPRMSRVVEHGNTVYLMGHVARDRGADIATQTAQVLERLDEALAMAGTDKSKLLSVNIWLADMAEFQAMNAVWDAWVDPQNAPARATVESRLASPDLKVEMMAVAAK